MTSFIIFFDLNVDKKLKSYRRAEEASFLSTLQYRTYRNVTFSNSNPEAACCTRTKLDVVSEVGALPLPAAGITGRQGDTQGIVNTSDIAWQHSLCPMPSFQRGCAPPNPLPSLCPHLHLCFHNSLLCSLFPSSIMPFKSAIVVSGVSPLLSAHPCY